METDRSLAEAVARTGGETASRFGLRFDRVVVRVLAGLRRFTEREAPSGTAVLLTLTAPIRTPAKTAAALEGEIAELIRAGVGTPDRSAELCGNAVRLRLVEQAAGRPRTLLGLVHNPDVDAERLMDLAERWIRGVG